MLLLAYYAQNYAGIIGASLPKGTSWDEATSNSEKIKPIVLSLAIIEQAGS